MNGGRYLRAAAGMALAGVLVLTALTGAEASEISEEERKIFAEKCSPCHSYERIFTVDPAAVREIIARMEAKNPSFFKDVGGDRLAEIAERMIRDPEVVAQREAWQKAVERGRALFADPSLGTNGKSCTDCHTPDSLRGVFARYPKFDAEQARLLSLLDKINVMISRNMGGKKLPLGDKNTIALEAYLKSLR